MSNVVVVGAGLAGLGAARRLVARGHEVTVVEARTRAGGRTEALVRSERRRQRGKTCGPKSPVSHPGWFGASPHGLRPRRAFLRFPVCPPGPSALARFRFPFRFLPVCLSLAQCSR
jgi:choline dehydrogenase-like flavoprotein